ncbi:hypothetical protein AX16_007558 [Volvariella volvacea WC 439]|nr:hypothetical protein AX16_007558 [Volvariella volvacea WC 439]
MNSEAPEDDYTNPDSPVPNHQEDLSSYFNRSASAVQAYADRFEHEYARPALQASQAFYAEQPITALFVAVFSILSILPVLTFIGFSIFVFLFTFVVAILSAICISSGICIASFFFLLFTLFAVLCISIFITLLALLAYTTYRLAVLVRQGGREGVSEWAHETKDSLTQVGSRVVRRIPSRYRNRARFGRTASSSHNQSQSPHSQGFGTLSGQSPLPPAQEMREDGFGGANGVSGYVQDRGTSDGSNDSAVVVKKEEVEEDPSLASTPGSYLSATQGGRLGNGLLDQKQEWIGEEDTVPLLTQPE